MNEAVYATAFGAAAAASVPAVVSVWRARADLKQQETDRVEAREARLFDLRCESYRKLQQAALEAMHRLLQADIEESYPDDRSYDQQALSEAEADVYLFGTPETAKLATEVCMALAQYAFYDDEYHDADRVLKAFTKSARRDLGARA